MWSNMCNILVESYGVVVLFHADKDSIDFRLSSRPIRLNYWMNRGERN